MAGYAEYLRQEGRQEGERTVLERLLQRRFGVLTGQDISVNSRQNA